MGGETAAKVQGVTPEYTAVVAEKKVRTSEPGRRLSFRSPPGVSVSEIGDPTVAVLDSFDAQ
jgi:hypothetical protein